jgi:hypothetical protein
MGKSALDHLDGPTDRMLVVGRYQQVNVVGHDDKFLQEKFAGVAIAKQSRN